MCKQCITFVSMLVIPTFPRYLLPQLQRTLDVYFVTLEGVFIAINNLIYMVAIPKLLVAMASLDFFS